MRCPACGTWVEVDGGTPDHAHAPAAPSAPPSVFRREGEYWLVAFEGAVCRLRDRKGLRYLATLLSSPGREILALQLLGAEGETVSGPARFEQRNGLRIFDPAARDEVVDAPARAAYERRLEQLREFIDQADTFGDQAGAARAKEEADVLAHELAAAVGVGGRPRAMPSPAEKARQSVTKAIRAAAGLIAEHHPALGRHLAATVRTGIYCIYDPDPRVPTSWRT